MRRAQGLPATSIGWGPWADGGMAADGGLVETRLRRSGMPPMRADRALAAMRRAVEHGDTVLMVGDIDWERFYPAYTSTRPSRLVRDLPEVRRVQAAAEARNDSGSRRTSWPGSWPPPPTPNATRLVMELVRTHVAIVLGYERTDAVAPTRGFLDMGFDSLTAVELRNRLASVTGLRLPSTLVFDYPTPIAMARFLRGEIAPGGAPADAAIGELDKVEALLATLGAEDGAPILARLENLVARFRAGRRHRGRGARPRLGRRDLRPDQQRVRQVLNLALPGVMRVANEDKLREYLKWVTADLRKAHRRLRELESGEQEPIAIVGMACRFAGECARPRTCGGCWRPAATRSASSSLDRGWDVEALYDPDPDNPGTSYAKEGGFPRRGRRVRRGLLRHLAPRGAGDGPAAAPAAGDLVGGVRAGHDRPGHRRARHLGSACSSAATARTTPSLLMSGTEGVEEYLGTGNAASVVSGRISYALGLEGPGRHRRHGVLGVAGGAAHGGAVAARRASARWPWRAASPSCRPPVAFIDFSRQRGLAPDGALQGVRAAAPTAPAGARASACCSWSGCRTPERTATPSSPSSAARPSTRTAPPPA